MPASSLTHALSSRRGSSVRPRAGAKVMPRLELLEGRDLMATGFGPFHVAHFALSNLREMRIAVHYDRLRGLNMGANMHGLRDAAAIRPSPGLPVIVSPLVPVITPIQIGSPVTTPAPQPPVTFLPVSAPSGTVSTGTPLNPNLQLTHPIGTGSPPAEVTYNLGQLPTSTTPGEIMVHRGIESNPLSGPGNLLSPITF